MGKIKPLRIEEELLYGTVGKDAVIVCYTPEPATVRTTVGQVALHLLKEWKEQYIGEMNDAHKDEAILSVKYRQTNLTPKAEFELNKFQKWIEKKLSKTSKED